MIDERLSNNPGQSHQKLKQISNYIWGYKDSQQIFQTGSPNIR